MKDQIEMREADRGDREEIQRMVEIYRFATSQLIDAEDPNQISMAMAAACTFAGCMFGTLIIAGLAKDGDKRRVTESMMTNFRSGIDIGKQSALTIAAEEFGGHA